MTGDLVDMIHKGSYHLAALSSVSEVVLNSGHDLSLSPAGLGSREPAITINGFHSPIKP
jgi:hypothetical protein